MRKTSASPAGSSAIRPLILAAADSVNGIRVVGSTVAIDRIVATRSALRIPRAEASLVTPVSRLVQPFSSRLVSGLALLASAPVEAEDISAQQLVGLPHLRAVRACDPGFDGRDVVRSR